ncbi:MAG TPA: Na/Pi cotransporter [Balneola sp.]|jgi:phosphate:Na+ symporter|nr:Na/Pi cotransporter [Balneola sp.]MAO76546.1 Na/Pi cotransporter [Balneola sp.]MBF65948.1 Na/Pi cotransporter [Balneola sp.]HAH50072.1 Na/Pi cotransporter [Balneola sp.]HAW81442.1 Na/Pi cotransporter [Balneola sp.]|tara:strand:+ start:14162 stop:15871 length:1710 start_codon:yes stop_codon:yes gene_type:complete
MEFGLLGFLNLMGSLGFFIYGMKVMSEGIQKVAGTKMRQILRSMTSNRFKGVLTGFALTALVQSSSATTVLVVSFVNAGLLALVESIGVIMGANIGTTITAWLISIIGFKVKISSYALPIIAIGFPLLFMSKSKTKSWAEVLIGFALLFIGLSYLKESVPDLKANPEILEFLSQYTDLGFLSTLLFVGIGTVLTVTVQSSSAAMALTLVMANNGWIPFDLAAAMVLGENIGTTITANLAALVANIHAKRAAAAHFIFNVFGVIWIIIMMPFFLDFIDAYMTSNYDASPFNDPESIPIALSIFHTAFNIINTLLLLGFVGFIAKTVIRMIPSKGEDDEEFHLEYIGTGMMQTAELSLEEATKETAKFGEITARMSEFLRELVETDKPKRQKKLLKKIKKYEEITDRIDDELASYLMKVSEGSLSDESTRKVSHLLNISNNLETIGDIFYQMSRDLEKFFEGDIIFNSEQKGGVLSILDEIDKAFEIMNANLNEDYDKVAIEPAYEQENKINKQKKTLQKKHTKRIETKMYNINSDSVYKDLFFACEKIGDHIINVSEAVTGQKDKDPEDK